MRRLSFAVAALFALASCGDAGKSNNGGTDDATEKTNTVYRAIETGDTSKLRGIFTEDCVDHGGAMDGGDIKGIDSIIPNLAKVHNMFEGLKMEPIEQATKGDYHFSLVKMTGTVKDAACGMPVGTKMNSTYVDVVKMKDGKASDHWSYMSMQEMTEMMKNMQGGATMPSGMDKSKMEKADSTK